MTIMKQSTQVWQRLASGGVCVRSREANRCKLTDIGQGRKPLMWRLFEIGFALVFCATPAFAGEPVTVTQLLSTHTTASGQPIVLPQHDVQLVVSRFVVAPGATLPTHLHPWQRYGYLLAGHLRVTLAETGQVLDYEPGDFIVEVTNTWHSGTAVGDEPAVLLVIDQVEAGHSNTLLQDAR